MRCISVPYVRSTGKIRYACHVFDFCNGGLPPCGHSVAMKRAELAAETGRVPDKVSVLDNVPSLGKIENRSRERSRASIFSEVDGKTLQHDRFFVGDANVDNGLYQRHVHS